MRIRTKFRLISLVASSALMVTAFLMVYFLEREKNSLNQFMAADTAADRLGEIPLLVKNLDHSNPRNAIDQLLKHLENVSRQLTHVKGNREGLETVLIQSRKLVDKTFNEVHDLSLQYPDRLTPEQLRQVRRLEKISIEFPLLAEKLIAIKLTGHVGVVEETRLAIYSLIALVVLAFLVAAYIINADIGAPLKRLIKMIETYSDGSFRNSLGRAGNDEIQQLAGALDDMSSRYQNIQLDMEAQIASNTRRLDCMVQLSRLIDGNTMQLEKVFAQLPMVLRSILKRTENSYARAQWGKLIFESTGNGIGEKHTIDEAISSHGHHVGKIELGYYSPSPEEQELLESNRELLRSIVEQLSLAIETWQSVNAMRFSEKQYRSLLDALPQRVFYKDLRGRYVTFNPAFAADLGLPPEAITGQTDLALFEEAAAREYRGEDEQVINRQEAAEFENYHHCGKKKISTHTVKTPYYDHEGRIVGTLGIYWDTTAAHEAEKKLLNTLRELRLTNEELKQFAYVASHDLQEPLRMVSSYMQLLESRYRDKLDSDAQEFIRFAVDGARRMKLLIDALLTYSRVGTRREHYREFDMNIVLLETLNLIQIKIEESHARLTYKKMPTAVIGDPVLIGQVLQNLVVNAIKFSEPDKIPEVRISYEENDSEWIFAVEDNGIGIRGEYREKIFIIFQRLHTQEKYPGTGIGLAICKKIVERHHGRIWVESEPGQGSCFYFTISKTLNHHHGSLEEEHFHGK